MALFGPSKKSIMEDMTQQLSTHPMLGWAVQVLQQEEQQNGDQKPADAWKHHVENYYDDGVRTVFVFCDYLGVLHGKAQQMFPTKEEEKSGWKMPTHDGLRYTTCGYEPLSGYCGLGYRDVMGVWIEVVQALMKRMYPNYRYSECATRERQTPNVSNEPHFDDSFMCYFTYTLPRPHYEKWFKEQ